MYGHLMSILTQAILIPIATKLAFPLGKKLADFFARKLTEHFEKQRLKKEKLLKDNNKI